MSTPKKNTKTAKQASRPSREKASKTAPAVGEETAILPPVRAHLGENFLRLPDDATDEEIAKVASSLRRIDSSFQWWLGDLLCELARLRPQTDEEGHPLADANPLHNPRVIAMMEMFGDGEQYARVCWYVCSHVEQSTRVSCSTFSHHRYALQETGGDLKSALRWVKLASEEKMSVANLRLAIRQALLVPATPGSDEDIRERFSPFYSAINAAKKIDISKLTMADRFTLKADAQPLLDLLAKL